jgi:hypothetical protein
MKWMPEGKAYLIWILIGLWVVLAVQYTLYPLWLKMDVNEGLIRLYETQRDQYRLNIAWLDNINKTPKWPSNWVVETEKNGKGRPVLVAKGATTTPAWNRWLDELYTAPLPITIDSCELRRLSHNEIFVTIRLTL